MTSSPRSPAASRASSPASSPPATRSGMPNVTYLSQVLSRRRAARRAVCQFFNKTRRTSTRTRIACVEVYDPLTLQAYRLRLTFLRSEKSGPLFDAMALRIDAIASHTGMAGVFRLIAADVFEVLARREGGRASSTDAPRRPTRPRASPSPGCAPSCAGCSSSPSASTAPRPRVAARRGARRARRLLRLQHTIVLLLDEPAQRLVTIASRGYGESGVGAEVALGEGLIGTVARERRVLRISGLDDESALRPRRAPRSAADGGSAASRPEIPLPGLPDAQSRWSCRCWSGTAWSACSPRRAAIRCAFGEWHEAFLGSSPIRSRSASTA